MNANRFLLTTRHAFAISGAPLLAGQSVEAPDQQALIIMKTKLKTARDDSAR